MNSIANLTEKEKRIKEIQIDIAWLKFEGYLAHSVKIYDDSSGYAIHFCHPHKESKVIITGALKNE